MQSMLVKEWLNALASETGRTMTALAREAIVEHIDDLEDYYPAEARVRLNCKIISWPRWSASLTFEIVFDPEAVKCLEKPIVRFSSA